MLFNELISKFRTPIMGCAMIAIMLFHQPFIYKTPIDGVFHLFGHWGVEMFLFVSGFGIVYSLWRNDIRTYYRNRLKRLLLPCLIVGICKVILVKFGFTQHTNSNFILLISNVYLWYIYAISVYYILAPMLMKLLKCYPLGTLLIVCAFSCGCTFIPFKENSFYLINHIGWVTARLPIFVFGMYAAMYPLKLGINRIFIYSILCFIACIVLKLGSLVRFLNIVLVFATPAMCIMACLVTELFKRVRCEKVLDYIGKHSLELYLWHEYIYWNLYRNEMFEGVNNYLLFLIAVGLSFFFAHLTSLLVSKANRCSFFNEQQA